MYHLPANVISATVGLVYINMHPEKTRVIALSYGINILAVYSFVSSQSTHVSDRRTDRLTDRITIPITR